MSGKSKVIGVSVPRWALDALGRYAMKRGFYLRVPGSDKRKPNLGGAALDLVMSGLREKGYFDGEEDEKDGGGQ